MFINVYNVYWDGKPLTLLSRSYVLILNNVNGAKNVTVGFFMPPEILRVGFFMGWPKRWIFLWWSFYDPLKRDYMSLTGKLLI